MASQALNLHLLLLLVLIRQWNSKLHNRWSLSLWHKENLSSHLARLYSHHLTRHPTLGGARSFQPPSSTFDPLTTTRACHFSGSCCYNRMHVKFARFLLSFGSRGFHFPPHKSVHSLRSKCTNTRRFPCRIDSPFYFDSSTFFGPSFLRNIVYVSPIKPALPNTLIR